MKTVLIVDYDPRTIDRIRRCVRALGAQTVLATDADSGEREFHRVLPDLTLVEDILPRRRGFQLCSDLKGSAAGAERAVLLMAHRNNGGRQRILASRCDDFIEQPFDEATLLLKVRKFLSGVPASDLPA